VPDSAGAALEPAPGAREDAADPSRIVEQFVVASWDQHLRQHQRVTVRDQQRLDKIRAMTDPATLQGHTLADARNAVII
jgi:transmembrane secretion effector